MAPDAPSGPSPLALLLRDQRQRWQRGERVLVESYLEQHPALREDAESALDLIYQEVVLREEQGETPRAEEFLGRFPQFAAQLALQFEVDQELRPGVAPQPGQGAPLPEGVPGYEVLSELGRGGMGVVYLAWQTGLHRLVALKMILAGAHASPGHRARFRTEAESVGRLSHPHIVQVYETGLHEGQPFFSMEYADGGSLARYLDGTPLPARAAARLIETLARATHFAHRAGIIHRDLKPANVLLTFRVPGPDPGTDPAEGLGANQRQIVCGSPKVSDFSLAKLLADGADSPTRSGDVLGTPGYMAPEQAGGRGEVGPATDVYALGAILYELLTGRPPFQAAGFLETLERIRREEPVPPRRLQPSVPRDLETVCLKCLEKEPRHRYATAEALADDLARFQAGRPILARPVGLLERGWKWVRRRPAVAALLAVIVVAVLSLAGVGAASYLALREAARREAHQRAEAEEGFHQALLTVDFMLAEAAQGDLADAPAMEPVRKRLLERARQLYQDLVDRRPLSPRARHGVGRALVRLADVQSLLGEHAEAERAYRQTIALLEELAATAPPHDDPGPSRVAFERDLGMAWNNLGMAYERTGRLADAEAALRQAALRRRELMKGEVSQPDGKAEWAGTWFHLGRVLARQPDRQADAGRVLKEALATLASLAAEHPDRLDFRHDQARALHHLGLLLEGTNPPAAEGALRKAIRVQKELTEREPRRALYRRDLADSCRRLGRLLGHRGPEAEAAYRQAADVCKRLAADFPAAPGHRHDLAGTLIELAGVIPAPRAVEAESTYGQAIGIATQLVIEFAAVPGYHQTRSEALFERGMFLARAGRLAEAEPSYMQGVAIQRKLTEDHPGVAVHTARHRAMQDEVARMLRRHEEQATARLVAAAVGEGHGRPLAAVALAAPAEARRREARRCLDALAVYQEFVRSPRPR